MDIADYTKPATPEEIEKDTENLMGNWFHKKRQIETLSEKVPGSMTIKQLEKELFADEARLDKRGINAEQRQAEYNVRLDAEKQQASQATTP